MLHFALSDVEGGTIFQDKSQRQSSYFIFKLQLNCCFLNKFSLRQVVAIDIVKARFQTIGIVTTT